MLKTAELVSVPQGNLKIPALDVASPDKHQLSQSPIKEDTIVLSLVIPTYNEGKNLGPLLQKLTAALDVSWWGRYELILVDDDSADLTWQSALDLIHRYPQLRVMRRQQEKGLSTAVIRGWQVAQGQVLGVIDADLQHPPEKLPDLLQAMAEGADLAVGSRHVAGGGVSEWSFLRRFLSRGAQMLGLFILPNVIGRVSDPMSGYFLVRRDAVVDVHLNPKGYKILIEVIGRGDISTIAEVGYVFQERSEGESKVSWQHYLDYIHHLLRLRSNGCLGKFSRRLPIQRFLRFGIVGFSGVFVDMAVLYLLHTGLGIPLTRSKIFAGEVAIINNFLLNDAWTFADVAQDQRGWKKRFKRFLKFNLICLSGLILNVLILNIIYNFVFHQRWAYLANLMAIAAVTCWNFGMSLKLGWRSTQTD